MAFYRVNAQPAEEIHQHANPVIPSRSADSFGFDASLVRPSSLDHAPLLRPWAEARDEWRAQISAENLQDVEFCYYRTPSIDSKGTRWEGIELRETDGALIRRPGAEALAYTEHAWRQLVNVLMQEIPNKPRGPSDTLRWLSPRVRRQAFRDLRDRSRRPEGSKHPLLLRSFIDRQTGVRALRAVVTGRHSGEHFDDLALSRVFDRIIEKVAAKADAFIVRGINLTRGHIVLDRAGDVAATLAFRNSEVGGASLEFAGGCYIRTLNAVLHRSAGVGVEMDLEPATSAVLITSAGSSHRRAHTLPRGSEEARAALAAKRMTESITRASTAARDLCDAWREALEAFPPGRDAIAAMGNREAAADVLLDLIEEFEGLEAPLRLQLRSTIIDEQQLLGLPFCSAAQIAGAFAVAARREVDFEAAIELRDRAARWVQQPFGKKRQPRAPRAEAAAMH